VTITNADIVLSESQVMADTDDGGGRMSGVIIQDNQVNNTFPDISRFDRVMGRTQLRKLFLAVLSANQDTLLGAHTILSRRPLDPNVHVLLFQTGSHTDRRIDAQDRLESFVVKSTEAQFWLWGTQLEGQRSIAALARLDATGLPEPGQIFTLVDEITGAEQFIRVTNVTIQEQTFTIEQGSGFFDFELLTLQIETNNTLSQDFPGSEPRPTGRQGSAARVFRTQVADAAKYFGARPLAEPASVGDRTIKLDTVFSPLVPSAQSETPLTDRKAGPQVVPVLPAASGTITASHSRAVANGPDTVYFMGRAIVPGSLTLNVDGGVYADAGGQLAHQSGTNNLESSRIDYGNGKLDVRWSGSTNEFDPWSATFTPGAPQTQASYSDSLEVTLQTRSLSWVFQARPLLARGQLVVEYRALGRWETLTDNGNGGLVGAGTGTIDYTTGTISVTLAALPDVDTRIIFSWGADQGVSVATTAADDAQPTLEITAQMAPTQPFAEMEPNSLSVSWQSGGVTRTLTDDGTGALTGDGIGRVFYTPVGSTSRDSSGQRRVLTIGQTAAIQVQPNPAPAPGADIEISMQQKNDADKVSDAFTAAATMSLVTSEAVEPNTFRMPVPIRKQKPFPTLTTVGETVNEMITLTDDGAGNLVQGSQVVGTINYTTGAVDATPDLEYTRIEYAERVETLINGGEKTFFEPQEITDTAEVFNFTGEPLELTYIRAGSQGATRTETIPAPDAKLSLTTRETPVSPSSILLDVAGKTYRDVSGALITDYDHETDAGVTVGSVDYDTGIATLSTWDEGADFSQPGSFRAMATSNGQAPTVDVIFRTAGAPLRDGSLILSGTLADGMGFSATADTSGVITGPDSGGSPAFTGDVQTDLGLVTLSFAQPVFAGMTYSAVAFTSLPLDPDLLGLDPTRLPSDGRVPVFDPADVLVVSNTKQTEIATATAGATETLARAGQAEIWVEGASGGRLDPAQFTADRQAGTLTWADPLTLQTEAGDPVTEPLTVFDRVEDMTLATDVQISGRIAINSDLTHDYDTTDTIVSSAVPYGDLRARVFNEFHQKSWDGTTWLDERVGDDTVAKYDLINNPIEISNQGSAKERWAIFFTGSTSFQVIGETFGVVDVGNISTDAAPLNPATNAPYFVMRAAGWGSGWVAGNTLRFNTDGAQAPFWAVRTVTSGAAQVEEDKFATQNRGDAD